MTADLLTAPARAAQPVERPRRTRLAAGLVVACLGLLAAIVLSIFLGARPIDLGVVVDALRHYDPTVDDHIVVRDLRIPRTLTGLAAGAALGLAGALTQALARNPLADPGLLGINQGAALGLVVAAAVIGTTHPLSVVWFSFLGATAAALLVFGIVVRGRGGANPVRLILAGMAVTYVLSGIVYAIVLQDYQTYQSYRSWIIGSLASPDPDQLVAMTPFLLIGTALAFLLARPLNVLALGDETGHGLGVRRGRVRGVAGVAMAMLCGAATVLAGPIVFVGLVVPYVARMITGPDYRWLLPYSLVLAATLLLVADVVGRVIVRPSEVAVGVTMAFVGAPVLIAMIRRRGRLPRL